MHSDERKKWVLEILHTKARGNVSLCARYTGVDRKTILKWEQEFQSAQKANADSGEVPDVAEIKKEIIKRVCELIKTCTDPRKLMDVYDMLSKYEHESGNNKTSLFDMIQNELSENAPK